MSSSNETMAEEDCLAPGILVSVKGLESDAGKPLNGGSGIILGPPSAAACDDSRRYPVLLYALIAPTPSDRQTQDPSTAGIIMVNTKKSIKAINLEQKSNQKCAIFKEAARNRAEAAYHSGDYKTSVFWMSCFYDRWPEEHSVSTAYANLVRHYLKQPKEALEILYETVPQMPKDHPIINESCYDVCVTIVAAKGRPEDALEWALKISTETAELKQLSIEAIQVVLQYTRMDGDRRLDIEDGDGPTLEVHRQAALAMLERDPDNANYIRNVAAVQCLLGDNKEGVRMYRRALAMSEIEGEQLESLKADLALAMMQCPGGSMEHYRVVGMLDDQWACVHKSLIGQYELQTKVRKSDGSLYGGLLAKGDGVQLTFFSIPDIDDMEIFADVDLPPREG